MICAICRKAIRDREVWTRNISGAFYHRFACPLRQTQPVLVQAPKERVLSYPTGVKR